MSKWESGERSPSSIQRTRLCDAFSITEAELFGGVTKEEARNIKITGKVRAWRFLEVYQDKFRQLPTWEKAKVTADKVKLELFEETI